MLVVVVAAERTRAAAVASAGVEEEAKGYLGSFSWRMLGRAGTRSHELSECAA